MTTTTNRAREALGMAGEPGKELSPLEQRITYTRSLAPAFTDAVASGLTPETLVRDAITALRNTPDLVKCEAQTFAGALMSAAQLGLRPNVPSLGHGWVLPYWSGRRQRHEAQWILGYQGMVELGYKSGMVAKITTDTIYSAEHYRIKRGTDDVLEHEPVLDPKERGEVLAHYAIVWLQTGRPLWKVIAEQDVRALMERVAARDKSKNIVGPWRDDYLPMAQKTPLRALWRFMPKTPTMALALATDGVIREGTEREPDPVEDPNADPIVVERTDGGATATAPAAAESDGKPKTEPAKSEPVDAEVVPDADGAAQPDQPQQQGETAEPASFTLVSGQVRERVEPTKTRQAYGERILVKHGERVRATIEQVVGEWIPPAFLTTAELRAVADFEWGD